MEEWRDIPSYEGLYQVSNLGRVRSLDRVICHKKNGFSRLKGSILTNGVDKLGYERVWLYDYYKKRKTWRIHQLVAIVFLGHTPNGHKIVVDHIDGNTLNNIPSNLQLISQRENTLKSKVVGSSIYDGVCYCKQTGRWIAQIKHNRKKVWLKRWKNELRAAAEVLRYKEKHSLLSW